MKKIFTNTKVLIALLLLLSIIDVFVGTIDLWNSDADVLVLLTELRLPKTLTAIGTGSILALCGLVLQILFRNPLAGPYVLGISSASSLFAAIGIMSVGSVLPGFWHDVQLTAFSVMGAVFGLIIILLVLKITSHIVMILLIGLMLSQLYGAMQSILSYLSNENALKIYTLWTMGSIQNTNLIQALILFVLSIAGLLLMLRYAKHLTIYITGDENAKVMGVDVDAMKKQMIIMVAILVGMITAYCGPVALVGMSVPVFVRIINGNADVLKWMVQSYLYGGIFVLATDVVNQLMFNGSLPLNILISMWGVPLMIWVLIKYMKFLAV